MKKTFKTKAVTAVFGLFLCAGLAIFIQNVLAAGDVGASSRPNGSGTWQESRRKKESYFSDRASNKKGLQVSVVFADDLDTATAATPDSVSDTEFYVHVTNATDKAMPLLSVPTGIKEGSLAYIRVEGVTGFAFENGILVLQYLSLLPGQSADITVTGIPLISSDSQTLTVAPQVRDKNSAVLVRGDSVRKLYAGKKAELFSRMRFGNTASSTSR